MTMPHIPERENHPFDVYIPQGAHTLILGSFPCLSNGQYGDWYYSGSGRNGLWKLLSLVFDLPASNREEKEDLCKSQGIAMADLGKVILRKGANTCADEDLMFVEFNAEEIERAIKSGITKIISTSRFVTKTLNEILSVDGVQILTLPSPSPNGSRPIGRIDEYKLMKQNGVVSNTFDYKLLKYREALIT